MNLTATRARSSPSKEEEERGRRRRRRKRRSLHMQISQAALISRFKKGVRKSSVSRAESKIVTKKCQI